MLRRCVVLFSWFPISACLLDFGFLPAPYWIFFFACVVLLSPSPKPSYLVLYIKLLNCMSSLSGVCIRVLNLYSCYPACTSCVHCNHSPAQLMLKSPHLPERIQSEFPSLPSFYPPLPLLLHHPPFPSLPPSPLLCLLLLLTTFFLLPSKCFS